MWSRLVQRKRHLDHTTLVAITVAACVPLLLAWSRFLALPGGEGVLPILAPLRALGSFLNGTITFAWVPPSDRPAILFLLLIPTGALLVAVFRLTLGIRVLGLRAILLAIGFRAIGVLPGLALLIVVVGTVLLIRPWVRRIRLPLYGRLTFILGTVVTIMIGAALFAPWLRSDAVWRVAFFPVIILAMLAEGLGRTLERDDLVTAVWRATWTIVLALLLALIDGPVSRLNYQSPELIVTQLMSIVLVGELFDLRLLEPWPARIARYLAGARPWYPARPRVAVVCNPAPAETDPAPDGPRLISLDAKSVKPHAEALREQGFEVTVVESGPRLMSELARSLPPHPLRGTPGGIVLNLATGMRGEGRFAQVPALLEMAGIPYTGSGPLALARMTDRFALMTLLQQAQVPVPRHYLVSHPTGALVVEFPASVRPRYEPLARRIVVRNRRGLRRAVRAIRARYGQASVVEEIIRGRALSVPLLGNDDPECLPPVEMPRGPGESRRVCPAPLDETVASQVNSYARAAFWAAGCRDYARVDLRLAAPDRPVVVDVRAVGLFARRGTLATAAEAAGCEFDALMRRIVTEAAKRYLAAPRPDPLQAPAPAALPAASVAAAG